MTTTETGIVVVAVLITILIIFLFCKFLYKLKYQAQQRDIVNQLMFNSNASNLGLTNYRHGSSTFTSATIPQFFLSSETVLQPNPDCISVNSQTVESASVKMQHLKARASTLPPPLPSLSSMPALSRTTLNAHSSINTGVDDNAQDDPNYSVIKKDDVIRRHPPGEVKRSKSYFSGMSLEDEIMGILNIRELKKYECSENKDTDENEISERDRFNRLESIETSDRSEECESDGSTVENEETPKSNEWKIREYDELSNSDQKDIEADKTNQKTDIKNIDQILSDPDYDEIQLTTLSGSYTS